MTFRATLWGLADVSAHALAKVLQEWVSSGPSIKLEWYLVDIDKDCPVAIASDSEPECHSSHPVLEKCMDECLNDPSNLVLANKLADQ